MSPPAPPPIPDHQLLRRIGRGAYGEVWLAQNALGFYRAVKIVYRGSFEDERAYSREFAGILRFEPISRLHESQIDILHVGRTEQCFYYVMELADDARGRGNGAVASELAGSSSPQDEVTTDPVTYVPRTLESERATRSRLPLAECTEIGLSLTTALVNLHKHGLVHRDIKPSNVIFIGGLPRLADIGLVTGMGAGSTFVGTEGFVAPEGPGTRSADLYSLGKVLYEISTGRDRQEFPAPPADLAEMSDREAWLEFNEIILRACETLPPQRYQSAEEMQADLAVLRGGQSVARLRRAERRLKVVSRVGIAAGVVALLALAAGYQAYRSGSAVREELARLSEANGLRAMDEGDLIESLLWFSRTVELDHGKPAAQSKDRLRFGAVLGQCPGLEQVFCQRSFVNDADMSRDGRRVVTASADHTAQVWDVRTGAPAAPPLVHAGEVHHAEFSPDGRWVVTASDDQTAQVWDVATGKAVGPPLRHRGFVVWAAFSPDGRRVATASWDNTARIWDARTGEPLTAPLPHRGHVLGLSFSPGGTRLVTASADGTAQIWDVATGRPVGPALRHEDKVRSARFSPDGLRVGTVSEDHTGRLWDARTGRPLTPPLRHSKSVYSGVFSPDGAYFATASEDGSAQVWVVATGDFVARVTHRSMVRSVSFSPDGRWLLTSSSDHSARVWDVTTWAPASPPLKHSQTVPVARFSADGRWILTASGDHTARLWGWEPVTGSDRVLRHQKQVNDAEFSADGRWVVTASDDGTAQVWDPSTGRAVGGALRHDDSLRFATFSPDGEALVTATLVSAKATVWRLLGGAQPRPVIELRSVGPARPLWSPNGRWLVIRPDSKVAQILDSRGRRPVSGPLRHALRVFSWAFSPDSRLLAVGCGGKTLTGPGEVRLWEVGSGRQIGPALQTQGAVIDISFSPDGRWLLTASAAGAFEPGSAQVWEVGTGRTRVPKLMHADGLATARFSPDGRKIVTASNDRSARVWDARTGRPLTPPLWHERQVSGATFSPDGKCVLTTSEDGTARLWDSVTGVPLGPPMRHGAGVVHGEFSPDGRTVLTASRDHTARLWKLPDLRWSEEQIRLTAEVLTAERIDETGGVVPLDPPALREAWRALKGFRAADAR